MADCGCSGIRSCLICESKSENKKELFQRKKNNLHTIKFCLKSQRLYSALAYPDSTTFNSLQHTPCNDDSDGAVDIVAGITVIENFINEVEEQFILTEIEKFPWRVSQSGRRKQDFGPKVNFKKKRLKAGNFTGLPAFSQFIVERIQDGIPQLKNFHPVELCNLDYSPEQGASIDPHVDDIWIWGEHLVTINLLSDTILTLTHSHQFCEVQIPMPRFSLIILKNDARYKWLHGIKRSDITRRRIAVTLRELSHEFLSGAAYTNIGCSLLKIASSYRGLPTSS